MRNKQFKEYIVELKGAVYNAMTTIQNNTEHLNELIRVVSSLQDRVNVMDVNVTDVENRINEVAKTSIERHNEIKEQFENVRVAIKANDVTVGKMTETMRSIVDEFGCYDNLDDDYEEELIDDMDATFKAEIEAEIENDTDIAVVNASANMIPAVFPSIQEYEAMKKNKEESNE